MRRLLFLIRRSPHGTTRAREALDAILAAAAFDVPTSVLLDGDGVFVLLAGQDGTLIDGPDVTASWQALPMFDVDDIHVRASALAARGLAAEDLTLPVQVDDDSAVRALIARADQVLSF